MESLPPYHSRIEYIAAVIVEGHGISANDPAGSDARAAAARALKLTKSVAQIWRTVNEAASLFAEATKTHPDIISRGIKNLLQRSVMRYVKGLEKNDQQDLYVLIHLLTNGEHGVLQIPQAFLESESHLHRAATKDPAFWRLWLLMAGTDPFERAWSVLRIDQECYLRDIEDTWMIGTALSELQEEFKAWFAKQDKLYDIMDWTKDADSSIGMALRRFTHRHLGMVDGEFIAQL
jgi:DNA-binding protein Fis